ncbi:hypothetical protein ACFU99_12070 [Streptomyces sp. NPDC057654]|uniref:hypothetical protein n=1 Tax=Streptomyces sp. NPDC057654 TaxID=3346196 RepID=UPI0036995703
MDPDAHFVLGTHPQHGYVAALTARVTAHLGDWYLTRLTFTSVPDRPGLYRLTDPELDGPRRLRQAAQALRAHGYAVHVDADIAAAPAAASRPPRPNRLADRLSRTAQAAAGRSPQRGAAPATTPPAHLPLPPKPGYAPTVHRGGRSR